MTTFEEWYADYPRHESKLDAEKAWDQMVKKYDPVLIHEGLKAQINILSRKEKRFVKLPAAWLRKGCWMDDLEDKAKEGGDRTKRPFARWTEKDIQAAGRFLRRVGPDGFLRNGYTEGHLEGLRAARWLEPREVKA